MIYRGPGFLAIVWFGSSPTPLPLSCQRIVSLPSLLVTDGREGRGWGRSQIIRRRESLVLYKSFNNLCLGLPPSWILLLWGLPARSPKLNKLSLYFPEEKFLFPNSDLKFPSIALGTGLKDTVPQSWFLLLFSNNKLLNQILPSLWMRARRVWKRSVDEMLPSVDEVCGWDLDECGEDLTDCSWDLAERKDEILPCVEEVLPSVEEILPSVDEICGWDLVECWWGLWMRSCRVWMRFVDEILPSVGEIFLEKMRSCGGGKKACLERIRSCRE
jgi:hypothetical protein